MTLRRTPHIVDEPRYWDARYRNDEAGWDLGGPSPVFQRVLAGRRLTPGRALVLGSGRGHDAVAFARAGWRVTGVDFSPEALALARRSATGVDPAPAFVEADIFDLPAAWNGGFDLVVEYVTYCAIAPSRRAEFAAAVSRLLAPDGRLLALFFPVEERPGGPPFGVDPEEAVRLFSRHLVLLEREVPADSVVPRRGREVLTLWRVPEAGS